MKKLFVATCALLALLVMDPLADAQSAPLIPIPFGCNANDVMTAADASNMTCGATVTLGTSVTLGGGTAITKIAVLSVTWSPGQVLSGGCASQNVTVTGVTTADKIIYQASANLSPAQVSARVASPDTVAVTFCNPGNGTASPAQHTATIVAIRS